MNRTLKLFAAVTLIALTAAACQKEKLFDSQTAGEETVTFTVQTDAAATKATADNDGQGAGLTRCLVAVYMKTGNSAEPYKLYDTPSTTKQDNEHYSFTVNLIRKQTYQIVVWADKGKYTVSEDLSSVTRIAGDKACNSDAYDAFYASVPFTQGTTASTAITAKRPFAQLNLITKDLREGFEPKDIELTYTADTKFNPFDGTTSEPQKVTYTSTTPHYGASLANPVPAENTVAMNYLFANNEQSVLNEVKLKATFTDAVELAVANVPVRRNYRTNIKGNLFTEQTDYTITVDPAWSGETDVEWVSVATVAEANTALQAGKTNVAIESVAADSEILIPETSKTIGISLPSGNANAVTIKYKTESTSGQTPNLNVAAENNTGDLVINAPQSHVTLNGAAYNNVTASTSNTTLVVEEGVTIENLTVNQGAVEIYGTVNSIALAEGCTVKVWAVGDKNTFKTAYDNGAQTIELKNDITDFSSCIEIGRNLNLDGNGFAIHNTATRVVRITKPDLTVKFSDVALISKCTASSDVRCVSFDNIASGANVLFDNCELSASFYCINAVPGPEKLNVTLRNATVASGWAAINCFANNSTFTVENSTLKGLNDKGESSWNNYATIVFDGNGLATNSSAGVNGSGNTLNITNSVIYASSESSNNQAWLGLQYGAQRNRVEVDAATKIIDASGTDQTSNRFVGSKENSKVGNDYNPESLIWIGGSLVYTSYAASIGSNYYVTLAEALAAVQAGETDIKIKLTAGNYVIPSSAKGKTLTIVGTGTPEDVKVAVTQVDGANCDYNFDGSTVTFEGITITTNSATYAGYARCKGTYKNCVINGQYTLYGDSKFENCTFNVSGNVSNIWTWGATNAKFDKCTFNSDGKAMLLYGTVNTNLTIENSVFNDKGGLTDLKAAIEIGDDYGKSYTLVVNNTVVNGYAINNKGIYTGTTLWANKNSMGKDKLSVTIDGVKVY